MPLEVIEPRRLYRRIADQLRLLIDQGEFPVGSRLPAERELATQLGVSRPTVREALIALEVEGRLRIRVGSGIYVIEPLPAAVVSNSASIEGPIRDPARARLRGKRHRRGSRAACQGRRHRQARRGSRRGSRRLAATAFSCSTGASTQPSPRPSATACWCAASASCSTCASIRISSGWSAIPWPPRRGARRTRSTSPFATRLPSAIRRGRAKPCASISSARISASRATSARNRLTRTFLDNIGEVKATA